jgi:hypothetical protein
MLDQAKLQVRPAMESDLERILDLYAQAEFDAGRVLPLAAAKRLFERFADYPDYTLYVAEHGGDIVGTFALLVMHNLGHLGAARQRHRQSHDGIRARPLSRQGLLQAGAVLERQPRTRPRIL